MQTKFDPTEWLTFHLDTPNAAPPQAEVRQFRPGTAVKHAGRTAEWNDWLFGVVHHNEPGEVCRVIGYGWNESPDEKFVWEGTKPEFDSFWRID